MLNNNNLAHYKIPLLFTITLIAFYTAFAYDLVRTDYTKLILLYTGLFFLSFKLIQIEKYNSRFLIILSVLFRLLFILATPNLSQDFYRFIWDGRMIFEGFNPYLYTPESFLIKDLFPITQAQELYAGMGPLSASNFTNYPPVSQLFYYIAAVFSQNSILGAVVVLRLIAICSDVITFYFGSKLLKTLNLPQHYLFYYLLNPFIIIELTGNLHFEGLMIGFLIMSLFFLSQLKWKTSAILFSLAVATKLIPLLFLPLIFKHLKYKKGLIFCAIVGLINLILFLPFLSSEFILNYYKTVGLWFNNFEFNASIFNIFKSIGYIFNDYNNIALIGPLLSLFIVFYLAYITYKKPLQDIKSLITFMLLSLSVYYFMATTVHPWYISMLVILCVFTPYRFPLVWSAVIVLSYLAYSNATNKENLWIIGLEYTIVYGVFIYEVILKKRLHITF